MRDEKKKEKSIYNLELHESTWTKYKGRVNFIITRVPGGWLYESFNGNEMSMSFVPFNNDLQKC